jgi:hypothetical protein
VKLRVLRPHQFWAARRIDLPRLTDPHLERKRHPDRDQLNWGGVARAVSYAVTELPKAPVVDGWAEVVVADLGEKEQRICSDWGRRPTESPDMDPGAEGPDNGRHRLWACWQAAPEALLLVRSSLVSMYEVELSLPPEDRSSATLQAGHDALQVLHERLQDEDSSFDRNVEINRQFMVHVEHLASGRLGR